MVGQVVPSLRKHDCRRNAERHFANFLILQFMCVSVRGSSAREVSHDRAATPLRASTDPPWRCG